LDHPIPPHLQSALLTQLPDMAPLQLPSPSPPKPRKTMKVKPQTLTTKTRLTMTAVLEEDEHDPEIITPVQRKPSASQVKRTPSNSSSRLLHQKHSRSNSAPPSTSSTVHPSPSTSYSTAPAIPSYGTPGYTSLVLPRAPGPTNVKATGSASHEAASGKVDLTRSGLAQTTMASVEVCRGTAGRVQMQITMGKGVGGLFKRTGSIRMRFGLSSSSDEGAGTLGFMGYRNPPTYVPSGSVLVQVWAVGLDIVDKRIVHAKLGGIVPTSHPGSATSTTTPSRAASEELDRRDTSLVFARGSGSNPSLGRLGNVTSIWNTRSDGGRKGKEKEKGTPSRKSGKRSKVEVGFIPGRSFVGRVMECGYEVKGGEGGKRGEWVVGLVDLRKVCGLFLRRVLSNLILLVRCVDRVHSY
jgi:hypothetical protein